MAGMDDIDLFGAPPVTGSTRDRDLDRLERMVRGRYIDPLEQKAKEMVKNQVADALSKVEGIDRPAILKIIALADSDEPNEQVMFNEIASRLDLPINIRRMGDDYMASKRFEGALGRNSSVDVSAYRPDEGETQYSLSAQKRFPNFLGKNSSVGVSARVSTMGDPEIGARFEKRFADGGEVDIFGYNLGGSVSTMMGRTPEPSLPKLSEAQIANLSASFVPGAATTDIFGEFPEFPASDVSVKEMLGGQRAPSLAENIKEGEYLSAGLQGLGGIGDLAYAIPLAGPAIASVLKAPRALQKVLDLSRRVEDASDIFGEGAKRVRLTDKETGGTIELLERQDGSASVIELQVPEEFRGQGVGEALQAKALAEYPNMQGQVSSKAAATTAYRLGRRPYGNPDATLDDVFAQIDEMSSVNLISPERQLALDPNASKGIGSLSSPTNLGLEEQAETLRAIQYGMRVDAPIDTQSIYSSFGKDGVREIESAFKSNQSDIVTADDLIKRSSEANDGFQSTVDGIARSIGASKAEKFVRQEDGSLFDVEVKTPESIRDKVDRKGLAPSEFTDGVRTTIYVDTADQAEEAARMIGEKFPTLDDGWQRIPSTNYFDRKLNVIITDTSGRPIIGEIQLKTPEMAQAAKAGHKFYEYTRRLDGKYNKNIPDDEIEEYTYAMNQQQRAYFEAQKKADPAILDQIIDKFRRGGAVAARYLSFRR